MQAIPTMAELAAQGKQPHLLFWVGCAGSYDDRAQKVSRAFATILQQLDIDFAILGEEESCTGDPARRAGNEFLFQMQAAQNIQTLNGYSIQDIVTTCPHCFNTLKNEYPQLGGQYRVMHHTTYLQTLMDEGKLTIEGGTFEGKRITYHDSCYLGRANHIYEAPRTLLQAFDNELVEMSSCRSNGLCCGAGGAQMFKEDEPGEQRISTARAEQALATDAEIVAVNCPFCLTMLQDGIATKEAEEKVSVYDLSELIVNNLSGQTDQENL